MEEGFVIEVEPEPKLVVVLAIEHLV